MTVFSSDSHAAKIALVTGASRGIGAAIAAGLIQSGAYVYATATTQAGADKITETLAGHGQGLVFNASDREAPAAIINAILSKHNRIDILVNNAGITRDMLSLRLTDDNWDAVLDTNLSAAFRLIRSAIRPMMKSRYGRIVNMSSVVGAMGNAGQANYAASKAGLIAMSKSIAREVASRGITVNCVAPGFIDTDMTKALAEPVRESLLKSIPAARLGTSEDIAQAVLFLTSDAASYITGTVLHVNGGMYM